MFHKGQKGTIDLKLKTKYVKKRIKRTPLRGPIDFIQIHCLPFFLAASADDAEFIILLTRRKRKRKGYFTWVVVNFFGFAYKNFELEI